MEYITSDWHFGHRNMCGPDSFLETRKHFKDVTEMNQHLIAVHNETVKQEKDVTIHLGDICLGLKPKEVFEILKQMKGHFIFVKGNHDDSKLIKYLKNNNYRLGDDRDKFLGFEEVGIRRKSNGIVYYLTHYPLGLGQTRRNMRNICGHIHELPAREANVLNVGIDSPERPQTECFGAPILLEDAFNQLHQKHLNWFDAQEEATKQLFYQDRPELS